MRNLTGMAKFDPKVLNKLNTTFKDLITNEDKSSEEISGIVLTCFTYLLVALGKFYDCNSSFRSRYLPTFGSMIDSF